MPTAYDFDTLGTAPQEVQDAVAKGVAAVLASTGVSDTKQALQGAAGVSNPVVTWQYAPAPDLTLIGWDSVNFPLPANLTLRRISGTSFTQVIGIDSVAMFIAKYGDPATWPTYYVRSDGNDANPGNADSAGGAFGTVWKAEEVANAAGVPARIMVRGGTMEYSKQRHFSGPNGDKQPTVAIAYQAYNGRVLIGPFEGALTYAADATYPWVSRVARSNVNRVLDRTRRTDDGLMPDMVKVADLAACSRTPNSYAQVGTDLVINRADGALATNANTFVFIRFLPNFKHTGTQRGFLFYGAADGDGFDFISGTDRCFNMTYSVAPSGGKNLTVVKNCTFNYGGGDIDEIDAMTVDGYHGLAIFDGCGGANAGKDIFNVHNTAMLGAQTHLLVINGKGRNAGGKVQISNNQLTGHEDAVLVAFGGDYARSRGSSVHLIGTSRALLVGATIADSFGDKMNPGGGSDPAEVRAGDTARVYLRYCTIKPLTPANVALRTDETGQIFHSDSLILGTTFINGGTGQVTAQ